MRKLACLFAAIPIAVTAEIHEVEMLTRGEAGTMIYDPAHLRIEPGDAVRFLPIQRGHNAASIPDMLPEGAQRFIGEIDEEITVTFEVEGRYGIKCSPHYAMGMVMIIDVGKVNGPTALPQTLPDRARARIEEVLER